MAIEAYMRRKKGAAGASLCTAIRSRLTNACRSRGVDENFFGIIFRAIRLRKSVRTAAVKSPDRMRDVARIKCDQTRVIKVDDLEGTWAVSDTVTSTAFRMRKRSGIVGILISPRGALNFGGVGQFEYRG